MYVSLKIWNNEGFHLFFLGIFPYVLFGMVYAYSLIVFAVMIGPSYKRRNDMIDAKTNARITGVLFILGTVPMICAALAMGPILQSPDLLSSYASHGPQILIFALALTVMGLACAGIGISMYPALKRHGEGLALGVAGLRVMEGTLQIASAAGFIAMLALGREFAKAGGSSASFIQSAGASVKAANDWLSQVYVIPWCIAAFLYTAVFLRARLVPRWISVWGLVALSMIFASNVLAMLGILDPSSTAATILSLPIMPQEMVLAVWLIVKGYDQSAIAPKTISQGGK